MLNTNIRRQGTKISNPTFPIEKRQKINKENIKRIQPERKTFSLSEKRNVTENHAGTQSFQKREQAKDDKKKIKENVTRDNTLKQNISLSAINILDIDKSINNNYFKNNYKIILITDEIYESTAIHLLNLLKQMGINNVTISKKFIDSEYTLKNDNILYIIIKDIRNNNLKYPNKYILYQTNKSDFYNPSLTYRNLIANSIAYWTPFTENIDRYDPMTFKKKIYYFPLPFPKHLNDSFTEARGEIKYDVFIFCEKDNRTNKIIENLSSKYKIYVSNNVNSREFNNYANSKIIISFNNQDCFITKINEILQHNKLIMLENGSFDDNNKNLYDDYIKYFDFIKDDMSNLYQLYDRLDFCSINENYDKLTLQIKNSLTKIQSHSIFSLHKNFVSLGLMKNDMLFDMVSDKIYCLHLLETPFRINEFLKQKYVPNFEIYPAVKAFPGWKGCALSYQNMIWNARRCGLDMITICEDDCAFKEDFEEKYVIIKEFLKQYQRGWDIFVGCIANLPENTKVKNVVTYKGITFVELDQMYSMVFNIYNKSCFDTICKWNPSYENSTRNSIDVYLKTKNLKIITTYPFEFSCVNVKSTLWKGNMFDIYNGMFRTSLERIKNKIEKYNKNV